jgi:uncharacterized membrane protein YfcA
MKTETEGARQGREAPTEGRGALTVRAGEHREPVVATVAGETDLLAGSLLGAWVGASAAKRLRLVALRRTIAVLLVVIAVVLLIAHDLSANASPG